MKNTHCIYCTFDLINQKYYIGYQSQSDRIVERKYFGSPMNKDAIIAWEDKDNLFVSILGYFNDEHEGYAAETELQIFMNAEDDTKSWNGSNDSFRKGSEAKENLGFITRIVTWFGSGKSKVKREKVLKENQLQSMSTYIKGFTYEYPMDYENPLTIDNLTGEEETEENIMELNLNSFLSAARTDCYDRGYKCGVFPNVEKHDQELDVLRIELDGQLEARVFDLEQRLVGLGAVLANTPGASIKFINLVTEKAKLDHQINYIKEEVTGDKFYKIIASSFEKGYIDRINEDQ